MVLGSFVVRPLFVFLFCFLFVRLLDYLFVCSFAGSFVRSFILLFSSFFFLFFPSFLSSCLPFFLPFFLSSFLPFFLSSFLPFFLSSCLPFFLLLLFFCPAPFFLRLIACWIVRVFLIVRFRRFVVRFSCHGLMLASCVVCLGSFRQLPEHYYPGPADCAKRLNKYEFVDDPL